VHCTTGPGEQKAVNLASNPHVVMTTGCNRWDQGLDVMVEGKAQRVTDRATLERLAAAWATKWNGQWQFEAADGGFESTHPRSWRTFGRRRLLRQSESDLAAAHRWTSTQPIAAVPTVCQELRRRPVARRLAADPW
jgi:hypothetical protein